MGWPDALAYAALVLNIAGLFLSLWTIRRSKKGWEEVGAARERGRIMVSIIKGEPLDLDLRGPDGVGMRIVAMPAQFMQMPPPSETRH